MCFFPKPKAKHPHLDVSLSLTPDVESLKNERLLIFRVAGCHSKCCCLFSSHNFSNFYLLTPYCFWLLLASRPTHLNLCPIDFTFSLHPKKLWVEKKEKDKKLNRQWFVNKLEKNKLTFVEETHLHMQKV